MKLKASHVVLVAAALVLLSGLAFQGLRMRNVQRGDVISELRPVGLGTLLPAALDGWTIRDEPLGPSEFMQDAVAKNLNYDDYVNRIYQRGPRQFGVYVGYWSPGRMPVQKVASHTPDRCWTENGWRCEAEEYAYTLGLQGPPVARNRAPLKPGQWRRFTSPNGVRQDVVFWHLVGGELYDFGERFNAAPHPLKWWRDTVRYAFSGSAEQYFIRLTSDRSFEELADDPGFLRILEVLGRMGLATGKPKSPEI